jgi:hypothetical protein
VANEVVFLQSSEGVLKHGLRRTAPQRLEQSSQIARLFAANPQKMLRRIKVKRFLGLLLGEFRCRLVVHLPIL